MEKSNKNKVTGHIMVILFLDIRIKKGLEIEWK